MATMIRYEKVVLWVTQTAYRKMLALVTGFSDEVGWHGTVSRMDDNEFAIEDIFVYPQEVTGSTVGTDQAAYNAWLYDFDDDIFRRIRMHGHSHVNMSVSPSGVDDSHRQQILSQLEPDMFYIFMIWNKRLEVHTLIYDIARNTLYEDKDIELRLCGNEDMDGFLTDAKAKVQKYVFKKAKSGAKSRQDEQLGFYGGRECFETLHDPLDSGGQAWRP